MSRMLRHALRAARRKEGASQREIAPKYGAELVAAGYLREVVVRVAITGAIIERRWKLAAAGHAWLDADQETPAPPPVEDEDERTGT